MSESITIPESVAVFFAAGALALALVFFLAGYYKGLADERKRKGL